MATLNGTAGNDTLPGGFDHDTINGLGGNDRLSGEDGNDTLNGGAGNDKLAGGVENDLLLGDAGNDTLDGGLDDDTLKGGAGNDLYIVGSLFDVVEEAPGGGKDTIRATVTYQLYDGQEIESFILDSGDNITGTGNGQGNLITMVGAGRATMYGMTGNDTLKGGAGHDILLGGKGDDILTGGDGGDSLAGEDGADTMTGGKGNDHYEVSSVADKIVELAGQGTDFVHSTLASYTLGANLENLQFEGSALDGTGNALNNSIHANALANRLNGAAGNDVLFGREGNDTLDGGAGNDTLSGSDGADSMTGGAGNDLYVSNDTSDVIKELAGGGIDTVETNLDSYSLGANVENLTMTVGISGAGNGLNNLLTGSFRNNVLTGDAGNDTLDGGSGNDTLKGGAGNDLYIVDSLFDVVEDVGGGKDTIRATYTFGLTDGQEIEIFILDSGGDIGGGGNGYANLITMVGAGRATIFGEGGNDTLKGGIGDDGLIGGKGDDVLAGGKGNDYYEIDSVADKISELAGQGTDLVVSYLNSYTLGTNLENMSVRGLSGTGNTLNNRMFGNAAANILSGVGGNDTLDGGGGNDTLLGGAGNDHYVVSEASDIVTEVKGGGTDTIETTLDNLTLVANVENLLLGGVASLNAAGNELANKMTGNSGQNTLLGNAGNDTLDGGAGNDTLKGGVGDDLYFIDSINDVVEEGVGGGKDTIRATFTYQLNDGQEIESFILDSNLVIGGFGNNQGNLITMVGTGPAVMYGNGGNDTLTGGAGDDGLQGDAGKDILTGGGGIDVLEGGGDSDTLKGGAGDDVLVGGLGADALFGDAGADWFSYRIASVLELATLGDDKITGFQKGVDKIDLRDLIADFGIDADNAVAGKFVILGKAGANTIVQFDQDGSAGGLGTVTLATVTGVTVTAADFVLETS